MPSRFFQAGGNGLLPGFGRGGAAAQPGIAAALASIDAAGWSATYTGTPPTFTPDSGAASQHYVMVSRQAYDSTGTATTASERLVVTSRVRQAYPNQASLSTGTVALSDYVYSTDTISGVTNNSAETSPKPIANWVMPARQVVGNSVTLEVVAFHRNGVACVEFTATDGTTTVTSKVSSTVVSGRTGDLNAVIAYQATLDITSLTNSALVTCNAKVYPSIGAAASVFDSSAQSAGREFGPRHFYKSTSLAASPFYAYVAKAADAPNGIGTPTSSGVVSTTLATAKATPFDTVSNAIAGLQTSRGANGLDGCIIMMGNDGGTAHVLASAAVSRTQKCAALTITRDPTVAQASARVSFGLAVFRPLLSTGLLTGVTEGAIRFSDIQIVRTGTSTIQGEAATNLQVFFDNACAFDNASNNATYLSNSHDYHLGTTFTNLTGNTALAAATYEHRLYRGISVQPASTTGGNVTIEPWLLIGSNIKNPLPARGTRTLSGSIIAFNKIIDPPSTTSLSVGQDENVTGHAFVQNLTEYLFATSNVDYGVTRDAATGNATHIILWNNTSTGAFLAGRWNVFYDEGTTRRTSKLQSVKGNIVAQINTKSDVFRGVNEAGADASSATGNWAFMYGAGCQGNFAMYTDAGRGGLGTSFAQAYGGLGTSIPAAAADDTSERSNPLFTDDKSVTSSSAGTVFTVGAGGGTYTLQSGSPCKGIVASRVLSHDLAGTARLATLDAAGAYA